MKKEKIKKLFSNLCCSNCKSDFDEESIEVVRDEGDLKVIKLRCQNCGKSFGIAFLGEANVEIKNYEPFVVQQGEEPITYDDVIDAHRFIQSLDEHWQDYLPGDSQ
ncbi:hypothetical protein IJF81_01095 [bacterium]|nr:hypothetical protein [bacterium]